MPLLLGVELQKQALLPKLAACFLKMPAGRAPNPEVLLLPWFCPTVQEAPFSIAGVQPDVEAIDFAMFCGPIPHTQAGCVDKKFVSVSHSASEGRCQPSGQIPCTVWFSA